MNLMICIFRKIHYCNWYINNFRNIFLKIYIHCLWYCLLYKNYLDKCKSEEKYKYKGKYKVLIHYCNWYINNFRNIFLKIYMFIFFLHQDWLSNQPLNKTKPKLDVLTDIDMFLMVKKVLDVEYLMVLLNMWKLVKNTCKIMIKKN